jgi:hypothetical protein
LIFYSVTGAWRIEVVFVHSSSRISEARARLDERYEDILAFLRRETLRQGPGEGKQIESENINQLSQSLI